MKLLKAFAPALLWAVVITGLSAMPGIQLPEFNLLGADKIAHAVVYAVLTGLLLWCFRRLPRQMSLRRAGLLAFGLSVLYGVLMEFMQYAFVPGRFYEIDDMIANTIGATLGWVTAGLLIAFQLRRNRMVTASKR